MIDSLLFYVSFIFAILLPGFSLMKLIFREKKFSIIEILPFSFSISVAYVSLLGYLLELTGLDFKLFFYLYLISASIIVFINYTVNKKKWFSIKSSLEPPDFTISIFAVICVIYAAWTGIWLSHTADSFYHIKAVRSIIENNEIILKNLFFDSNFTGIQPSAGTWHLTLAIITKFTNLSADIVTEKVAAFLVISIILSIYAFSSKLFNNKTIGLLSVLFFLVLGRNLDFRGIIYPNYLSFIFYFSAMYMVFKYMDKGEKGYLVGASMLSFSLISVHLSYISMYIFSVIMYFLGSLLFDKTSRNKHFFRKAMMLILLTFVIWLPAFFWRISPLMNVNFGNPNLTHNLYGATHELFGRKIYLSTKWFPDGIAKIPYLHILLPFLLIAIKNKQIPSFLTSNALLIPFISLISLININIIYKFQYHIFRLSTVQKYVIYFILAYFSYLSATFLLEILSKDRNKKKVSISMLLTIFFSLIFVVLTFVQISSWYQETFKSFLDNKYKYSFYASKNSNVKKQWANEIKFLSSLGKSTLASDPATSYQVTPFTSLNTISVPQSHIPAQKSGTNYNQRVYDSFLLLDRKTDIKNTVTMLNKYNSEYILVNKKIDSQYDLNSYKKFDSDKNYFNKIIDTKYNAIFKLKNKNIKNVKSQILSIEAEGFIDVLPPKNREAIGWQAWAIPQFYGAHGAITQESGVIMHYPLQNMFFKNFVLNISVYNLSNIPNTIRITIGNVSKILTFATNKEKIMSYKLIFKNVKNAKGIKIKAVKVGQKAIAIDRIVIMSYDSVSSYN